MQTLRDIAPYVALAAAALSLVLLVLVLVAVARRAARCAAPSWSSSGTRGARHRRPRRDLDSQVRNLREAVEILTDQLDEHKRHLDHALTNRAIVRYDAFRDAGGEQSASFALLDNYRSGVVFSAIAARDFARIYVKHLADGVADRDLSPEEQQAVAAAVPRPLKPGERGPRSDARPAWPIRSRSASRARRAGPRAGACGRGPRERRAGRAPSPPRPRRRPGPRPPTTRGRARGRRRPRPSRRRETPALPGSAAPGSSADGFAPAAGRAAAGARA